MASVGDIYQVKMQTLHSSGETALTVFYYELVSGDPAFNAENAANEVDDNIVAEFILSMSDTSRVNRIDSINGMDNDDFFSFNPNEPGDRIANPLAPNIAASFRSPWPGPGTRRGQHRLMTGVGSDVDGLDGIWDSNFQTLVADLATALGAQLENANGFISPVTIVGGFVLGVSPTRNESIGGQWELNKFPMTQNSRKQYSWVVPT